MHTKSSFVFLLTANLLFVLIFVQKGKSQQPSSPLVASHQQYQQQKKNTPWNLLWIRTGPVVNSSRVESVQLDPSRPGTIYAAFGSGGLWKTVNNGLTWRPIFEGFPSYGIGDIALAPSQPETIYVGTGESLKKARNFTIPGNGIYRSDDGGESWTHLGLDDSWHIGEIAVHPQNPDIVLVAVLGHFWSTNSNRGLYLTENGGKSWQRVLYANEQTGANDVVWSPSDPSYVYASMWENHPDVAGKQSSIHVSHDGGKSWTKCTEGLPSGDQVGRIGLSVSHSNPKKAYALVDNRKFSESGAAQVYQTLDAGKTWTKTHDDEQKFLSRIGWYFTDIYVSPDDDNEIYALGVRLAHSIDGGKTFRYLQGNVSHINPSAASGLHLDQCEMWIHPSNGNHLVVGNDGGLYQSFDRGRNWRHFNNIPTGEFYDIEIDQTENFRVFAGAQDDATVFGHPNRFDPNLETDRWEYLWIDPWNGGDGCVTLADPHDHSTIYYSAQEGAFRRKNMATNRSKSIKPALTGEWKKKGQLKFNFVAPGILSPHQPKRIFIGGNHLFQSDDCGDHWKVISPDLSQSNDPLKKSVAAASIAESPIQQGLLYVGTDRGAFWVRPIGEKNWLERSGELPNAYLRSIEPSRHSATRVYIALSGLNYDDFDSHLYCSEDEGKTWQSISNNLPQEPVNVILEHPQLEDLLIAGTFRGVYVSINRGQSWSLLGHDAHACSIGDLALHHASNVLIVGTHGRGIFKIDLSPIVATIQNGLLQTKKDLLFPVPKAYLPYVSNTRPGNNFREFFGTTFSFWLNNPDEVKLSIASRGSKSQIKRTLKQWKVSGRRGINQLEWDLVTEQSDSPNPYFINYRKYLTPGTYEVILETSGRKLVQELIVETSTQN